MITRGPALLAAIVCFQVVAPACVAEDPVGKVSANVYASPAEVFDVYRHSLARRKWQATFVCLTPESRKLVILDGFVQSQVQGGPRVEALLKKYNVAPADVDAEYERRLRARQAALSNAPVAREANAGPDFDLYSQILDERVADKAEFFAALNELINGPDELKLGALKRVEVKDDKATGHAAVPIVHIEKVTAGGQEVRKETWDRKTFHFRKLQGGWLIELEQ